MRIDPRFHPQVKELVSQGEYQLRLKDLALAEKEKELGEHAAAEHASAKARFDALQQVPSARCVAKFTEIRSGSRHILRRSLSRDR